MTDDLAAWLLAQIAEDEGDAVRALVGHPFDTPSSREAGAHPQRWSYSYHEVVQIDDDPDTERRRTVVADCGRANVLRARHIANWSPARVLAECDAKRRVINEYLVNDADAMADKDDFATHVARTNAATLYRALQCLALPYADRPGYREEWRP